jgi:mannose-6-phosphate isomerase-like protein (cupin superfamily)
MTKVIKPWGSYEILYPGEEFQLKRLIVDPGEELSYQLHWKRSECWYVQYGEGWFCGEGVRKYIKEGEYLVIPRETTHWVKATTRLTIIEFQMGDTDEEDIVRIKDKYKR